MANKPLKSIQFPGLSDTYTVPQVDASLATSGAAADAKKVGDEISDLKQDLIQFTGNQSFTYLKDKSISRTAPTTISAEANWECVLIECVPGDVFYVRGFGGNSTRLWMFSDENGQIVSESPAGSVQRDFGKIIAPENTKYLSCNSRYTNGNGVLIKNAPLMDDVKQLESVADAVIDEIKTNIFNKDSTYVENKYCSPTGTIATLSGWGYIDVPVIGGRKLSGFSNGNRVLTCLYSGEEVITGGENYTPLNNVIELPERATMLRVSSEITAFPSIMFAYSDSVIKEYHQYGENFPSANLSQYWNGRALTVNSSNGILQGVMDAYLQGYNRIVVEAGEYDLIAEYKAKYGDDCFDNYETGYNESAMGLYGRGVWLENIEIAFNPGAKVVCEYTGSNTYVKGEFSAFATGNNVVIEGLVLDATEVRYGIHADFNTGNDLTYFKMRDCDLHHFRNDSPCQAIGAGLGVHVRWEFDNIIFRTDVEKICFRIHNNVSANAKSDVYVRNCYVEGPGYMSFNSYSSSTAVTPILVSGCSWITPVVNGKETEQSEDNMLVYAFANETRES